MRVAVCEGGGACVCVRGKGLCCEAHTPAAVNTCGFVSARCERLAQCDRMGEAGFLDMVERRACAPGRYAGVGGPEVVDSKPFNRLGAPNRRGSGA